MTIVYELPRDEVRSVDIDHEDTIPDVEHRLVQNGTDTTRALFAAAKIILEVLHPDSAQDPKVRDLVMRRILRSMPMQRVVVSAETEGVGSIVGVGVFSTYETATGVVKGSLDDLAVLPEHQRGDKRHGATILQHIETALVDDHAAVVELRSEYDAIPFYAKQGYQEIRDVSGAMYKRLT